MTLGRKVWNGFTLLLGMYTITVLIYWAFNGDLAHGMVFGLMTASAKTVWSLVHKAITHREPAKIILTEEAIPSGRALEAEADEPCTCCREAA